MTTAVENKFIAQYLVTFRSEGRAGRRDSITTGVDIAENSAAECKRAYAAIEKFYPDHFKIKLLSVVKKEVR